MGLGDEAGQIREGFPADMLPVDGDPVADVRVLQDWTRWWGSGRAARRTSSIAWHWIGGRFGRRSRVASHIRCTCNMTGVVL